MAVATWNKLSGPTPGAYQDLYEDLWETAGGGGLLGYLQQNDTTAWLDLRRPCRIRYTASFNTTWSAGQLQIVGAELNVQPPQDYGNVLATAAPTANTVTANSNPLLDKFSHHVTGELLVPNRYLAAVVLIPLGVEVIPSGLGKIWIRAFYDK